MHSPLRNSLQVLIIVAVTTVASLVTPRLFPLATALENRVNDLRIAALSPPEPQHPDVVVVAITEETLATLPYRSPIDRRFLANLLKDIAAAGPRAIGLDILFDQPTEPNKDAELRDALRGLAVPAVVAWAVETDTMTKAQLAFMETYLEGLNKGYVNLLTDPIDGTIREIFPGRSRDGVLVPGFSAALVSAVGVSAPANVIPLIYRPPPKAGISSFRSFPAHLLKVIPKPVLRQWLGGKIVLIGSDLPLVDRHLTPMSSAFGAVKGAMAGVFVHAHALAHLLKRRPSPFTGVGGEIVVVALLAMVGVLIALVDIPVPATVLAGGVVLVVTWTIGFALVKFGGPVFPLVTPTLSLVFGAGVGSAYLGRRERHEKRFIRRAFSRFVDRSVVDQLIADPSKLSLGGERRELTYIFTDIANFTSLTEKSDPAVLLPILNSYLDGMTRIVLEHTGTIDRIAGDSLAIIFNAPVDQPHHPAQAVGCAMALDAFAQAFADDQQASGFQFGGTRIGVHSGWAVIGNFGGDVFFDYTAHGDMVNTAARLETVNKHLGTRVCVSGVTAARCPETSFRPIGTLILKGKTEGLETFEPLTAEQADSQAIAAYGEAFEMMKRGDPAAAGAFRNLVQEYPRDTLAALHNRRLARGETGVTIVFREK